MHHLRFVLQYHDLMQAGLARKGQVPPDLAAIGELAAQRLVAIREKEARQSELNALNEGFVKLLQGTPQQTEARERARALGDEAKAWGVKQKAAEDQIEALLMYLPNLPAQDIPDGPDESGNVVLRTVGQKPVMDFAPKPHYKVGERLGVLDFERAAKLSGPRFAVLWGQGAALERALITLMLDMHVREHGYTEVYPPFMVKADALRGTGSLPKFEDQLFKVPNGEEGLYLIPTAEVPLTNLHAGEILDGATLPRTYVAYTPCFRSEAGSAGRDTRGLIRQHQFDKVELVRLERPEDCDLTLETITGHAEAVLQRLELPYRVSVLCAGDLSFSARKTYDLEVWLPSQDTYREISSCSDFGDFQARRAGLKYRPTGNGKDKPRFLHTFNGSGLAVGRTLAAILENYQQRDGTVVIPQALRPYMHGDTLLTPRK